jgi:hypothetical protein
MSGRVPKTPPVNLPQHVADCDEWKTWPRKAEAHVLWGVRERQVTALCREERLKVYRCPDETLRLDPSQLEQCFGPPGVVSGRERDVKPAERARRAEQAKAAEVDGLDLGDPLPGLVRELTGMVRELRIANADILKLVLEPAKNANAWLERICSRALDRNAELEGKYLEVVSLHAELLDMRHIHSLQVDAAKAAEQRRNETLALLKAKAPALLDKLFGTADLASFVKGINPELIKAVLESGLLDEDRANILRRVAGIPSSLNGKADHAPQPASAS